MTRDAARIGGMLELVLPEGLRVERCELESWRPAEAHAALAGASFLSSYRVTITDAVLGTRRTQIYCGCTFPGEGVLGNGVDDRGRAWSGYGPAIVRLPALRTVLYAFPHDPALTTLPSCLSREAVEACLSDSGDGALASFDVDALKYDPGRGCTLRFTVQLEDGTTRALIGKTHMGRRLARTYATLRRLEANAAQSPWRWRFSRALGYDEARRLLWQEALPGRSFWGQHSRLDLARTFRSMAEAAAAMHATSFAPEGIQAKPCTASPGSLLAEAPSTFQRQHGEVMERLYGVSCPPGDDVSLHGDFHPNQFLIDGRDVGLADFDKACWGDPGQDLGCFASHVLVKSVQYGLDPERFIAPLETFFAAYAKRSRRPGIRLSAAWHTAAQLLGRRTRKLLERDVDPSMLMQLLTLAERYVDEAQALERAWKRSRARGGSPRG